MAAFSDCAVTPAVARISADGVPLASAAALDLRQLAQLALDAGKRPGGISTGRANEIGGQAFTILKQDLKKVLGCEALMAAAQCQALRGLNESAGAFGEFFEIHGLTPSAWLTAP